MTRGFCRFEQKGYCSQAKSAYDLWAAGLVSSQACPRQIRILKRLMKLRFLNPTTLFLLLLIFSTDICVLAQEQQKTARKFDEYGDINCEDAMARLDNLAITLQQEPGTKAYFIIYRGRKLPGRALPYPSAIKSYLPRRGIDADRILIVDGGEREDMWVETWIVPAGASAPAATPSPQVKAADSLIPVKYDEGWADLFTIEGKTGITDDEGCSLRSLSLKNFADALRIDPDRRGFLIVYTQFGKGARRARQVAGITRKELVKDQGIAASRIRIIYGGQREYPAMELWLVPKVSPDPKPTPQRQRKDSAG